MTTPSRRSGALALGVLLTLIAWPSAALAPVIALLAKQLVEQSMTSLIKDTLLNSLNGMGCKGIALTNALNTLDSARPRLGSLPGMPGMPGMDATMIGGAEAKMRAMMPADMALDPGQLAMMQDAQTALANPLAPPETVATIDELAELGFLPAEFQTELKECMVLVPASVPALGMSMGMFKPMVPQLREARDQMRALSPAEQDELASAMAEELQSVSTDDRKVFIESLDGGFFPPRVSEGVKAQLGAK